MTFDSIRFQVLWSRVIHIADEMAATLVKTAFSNVVRENHDYACGIYDDSGRMLAQSSHCTPGHIGAMPRLVRSVLERFPPAALAPGDVLITNDPWLGAGHTPDVFIVTPVFLEAGNLVGFVVNCAHHIDVGGRLAAPDAREVYEEGLIIPVCKLHDRGIPDETLLRLISRNVRMSEKMVGDLRAQIAANHLGARRLAGLVREMGLGTLGPLAEQIIAHTERSMRAAIREVPDGVYTKEVEIEAGVETDAPIRTRVQLEVAGDEIRVDLLDTSPQVPSSINCVYNITYAYAIFPVKCALHPHIPNNEGCARPVHLSVPEGTILNARFPAACMWRTSSVYFLVEGIFAALADAIPQKVMAPSGTYPLWLQILSGKHDDGRPWVGHFNAQGGQGARFDRDGVSTTVFPPNVQNTPVEMFESETTLLCRRKALIADSGGAGRQRGGLGQEVTLENAGAHPVVASLVGGRFDRGAPGLAGGKTGARGEIVRGDGRRLGQSQQIVLASGESVTLRYPGGGGFGDPAERDPSAVCADIEAGVVSRAQAETDYALRPEPDTAPASGDGQES